MKKGNTRQKHALKKRESRKKCQQWQYASLCWRSCISLLGLCFIHRHRSSILCHTSIMSAKRTRVPHIMHWHFDSLTRIRLSSPLVCFDWIFFHFSLHLFSFFFFFDLVFAVHSIENVGWMYFIWILLFMCPIQYYRLNNLRNRIKSFSVRFTRVDRHREMLIPFRYSHLDV